jgi:hypothetical protein
MVQPVMINTSGTRRIVLCLLALSLECDCRFAAALLLNSYPIVTELLSIMPDFWTEAASF